MTKELSDFDMLVKFYEKRMKKTNENEKLIEKQRKNHWWPISNHSQLIPFSLYLLTLLTVKISQMISWWFIFLVIYS